MTTHAPADFHAAPGPARGERVVVGLSGGVDSAVTTLLLAEAGCEVVAVTTRNFCFGSGRLPEYGPSDLTASCCSQEAVDASAELSADLDIRHVVLDVADEFERAVIDDYVDEYRAGHTPSPCVRCNTQVRFPRLLDFADRIGASRVATGHYARLMDRDGERFVARGADAAKDQSYFLFRLPTARLQRTLMPLGERTKDEVRALARRHGLPVADAPESQELCFVPDGDRSRLLAPEARAGEIVDLDGTVLGTHEGIEFFTVGQRKGLGLGGGPTRYVVALDAASRRVVVGPEESLLEPRLVLDDVVWRDPLDGAPGLVARTRYRHRGIPVDRVERDADGVPRALQLREPDRAPALGQAVVLYRDDVVVGGGRLAAVGPASV